MSRKRIPLNQNGCTANFRIGVPFEQNLHNITRYISKYLGLNNIFDCNAFPFSGIDDVITERGSIAHKVYGSSYIKEVKLIEYIDTISNAVKEIELTLYKELPKIIHKKPWNNTY